MGLQAIAKKAVKVAFNAAGDAIALVIYRTVEQGDYIASEDKYPEVVINTEISLLFDSSSLTSGTRSVVEQMVSGQRIALMMAEDLAVPPTTEAKIIFNGNSYSIVAVAPADPLPEPVSYNLILELIK